MFRRRDSDTAWVFGAAVRAASNADTAEAAAKTALRRERGRDAQMSAAVCAALAESPCEPLADLPLEERLPIGLARITGLGVDDIAAILDCDGAEVKLRMRAGLTRLADARQQRRVSGRLLPSG